MEKQAKSVPGIVRRPRGPKRIVRCKGHKRNGERCGRFQAGEFCILHSKGGRDLAQAMQRKKVAAEAAQLPTFAQIQVSLKTPDEILAFTEQAVAMQADGRLTGHAGYQIASLLQVAIRAHELIAAGKGKHPQEPPEGEKAFELPSLVKAA